MKKNTRNAHTYSQGSVEQYHHQLLVDLYCKLDQDHEETHSVMESRTKHDEN
jgi:hypothetical protein